MTDTEKKDLYIAAGIGGVALVVIFLYLHSGTVTSTDGAQIPVAAPVDDVAQTPYNYNVVPYSPTPPLTQPVSALNNGQGGDCCDSCGFGGTSVNVANYTTLMGTGAA